MTAFKKIRFIIPRKDKFKLIGIFIGMIFNSLFDLVGVSAILPIVSLVTTPELQDKWYFDIIRKIFHIAPLDATNATETAIEIATILIICLSLFFIVKTGYFLFIRWATAKFNSDFTRTISSKMIKAYLQMPYEYHLEHNSSTLLRSATYDVRLFANAMNSIMQLVLNGLTTILIIVFLFINSWLTTLIVGGILAVACLFFILVLRRRLKSLSKQQQVLNGENYRLINQAFSGIKESKISNTELYFANKYEENVSNINVFQVKRTLLDGMPGLFIESLGMIALLLALLIAIKLTNANLSIIADFALLAMATVKLLPAVININNHINSFIYSKTSINSLFDDLMEAKKYDYLSKENEEIIPLEFNNEIVCKNINFMYKNTDKYIIKNGEVRIKKGESIALSGNSGAGKTTMVDIILGLLKPEKGTITCDGKDIYTNMRGWHTNFSYIPQVIYLMDDTIRNNVAFGVDPKDISDETIWKSLEQAELKEFVESLPNKLDTIVGERGVRLSGGQRQRIGIARALYRDTPIIVFDEATNALDYDTESAILNNVESLKGNKTIIIITHRLNTIENCNHIYKVEDSAVTLVK